MAEAVSQASYAEKLKVGAIIVKDGNVIAFGYNGTPAGFDNRCEDSENVTKPEVLHAESNAIAKCAKGTVSSDGSVLYTTTAPCFDCAKLIIQAGIKKVFYRHLYRNNNGLELLTKAGIEHDKVFHSH